MVKGASKTPRLASTLGARIRMVRKAWGWTQDDLAQALGNDRQIVSYWELNKAKPTRTAMQLLAQVFRLPLEALATGNRFTIPDLPEAPETTHRMDAVRRAFKDLLPDLKTGSIQAVDLAHDSMKPMTLRGAKACLDRAHKEGRTVWIVASLEDPR